MSPRPSAASFSYMSSSGCSEWTASSIVAWRSPTSAKARGHGRDRAVLRRDFGELVPGDRCGDRRARRRPDAVGRGNRAIAGVLVVVDEDALAALLLPPVGRDLAW